MRPTLLTLYLTLLIVGLPPAAARAGCQNDLECKGDRICVDGPCTSPKRNSPGPLPPEGTVGAVCSAAPSRALKPALSPFDEDCDSVPMILRRIADASGVRNRPALFSAELERGTPGYAAIRPDQSRIVVISEKLAGAIPESEVWSTVYLLGHELGHHVEGHVYTGTGCSKKDELEASRFGGRALRWLGASYSDVIAVARSRRADECHDAGKLLEDALVESYAEGGEQASAIPRVREPEAGAPGDQVMGCWCDDEDDEQRTPEEQCSSGFSERLRCDWRDEGPLAKCQTSKVETNSNNPALGRVQVGTASRRVCTVTAEKKWTDGYPVQPCGCYPRALAERSIREPRCESGSYAFWSCPNFGNCDPRTELPAMGLCAWDERIPYTSPCGQASAEAAG